MQINSRKATKALAVGLTALLGLASTPAGATEGYFQNGWGARSKALAGAGVADSRDATAAAQNPAGLVHVTNQTNMAVSIFSPRREMEGTQFGPFPGVSPNGVVESGRNYFYIPNMAMSYRLDPNPWVDVIALTVYGNGGMNTSYPDVGRGPIAPPGSIACLAPPPAPFPTPVGTRTGVFCNGQMGVNLEQAFMSVAMAKQFGRISVGVAPIVARQVIELDGLQAFSALSTVPGAVSNQGQEESWGVGVRAGVEITPMENVRIGVAGNSRVLMEEFSEYRGLFAEQGDFDVPPSIQVGLAVDLMPELTVMLDYKHIWYSTVDSVGNPSANILNCAATGVGTPAVGAGCLGADNGAGFGWDDINIIKVGLEWRPAERTAVRLGYGYSENPIGPADVMFNIIAPGVVEHHIDAGAQVPIFANWDLEIAGMYAFDSSVTGFELGPPAGNPAHQVEISMHQFEVTVGMTYHFDGKSPLQALFGG
jgi:long-chain fatty acid transport protein